MPTDTENPAKKALDKVIRKSRVHMYKPIRIAEILYRHRTETGWKLKDLESYRNPSKRWRDEASTLLVGRKSTSSQRFQDNVFEANALTPGLLTKLGRVNKKGEGFVEAYIYKALEDRLASVHSVYKYISESETDSFSLMELVGFFKTAKGLRRSVDKIYEILVYALFSTVVRALKAQITLEIANKDEAVLKDFGRFVKTVLGIDARRTKLVLPAALYRVGVANAADSGLDIWTNFGPAIQVKHLTLTPELVEDMANDITADKIVVVCVDTEKKAIESLLRQVGWGRKIQGIVTIEDLDDWYKLCLNEKYRNNLGTNLLGDLSREFAAEFPSIKEIGPFMRKRGYDKIVMPSGWKT